MGFTRAFLKTAGLNDDQITVVMEEHVSVTDALKQQRDAMKAEADKLAEVQAQLEEAKKGAEYQAKYDQLKKEFDEYKAGIAREAETEKVREAYRELLKGEKISEKRFDVICRATDFSGMKLDKDGKLTGADALREAIRKEWGDFRVQEGMKGANVETPPTGSGSKMTRQEILDIKDAGERQKAIAENHELFGF